MDLTPTALFGGTAALGFLATMWRTIRLYMSKVYSLVFVRAVFSDHLAYTMTRLLWQDFKCSKWGAKNYSGICSYVRPKERMESWAAESPPAEPTIWWRGRKPLVVSRSGSPGVDSLTLTFIRGMFSIDALAQDAMRLYNGMQRSNDWRAEPDRFAIYRFSGELGNGSSTVSRDARKQGDEGTPVAGPVVAEDTWSFRPVGWTREQLGQPRAQRALDKLALSQTLMAAVQQANFWRDNEKWYKAHGIPWKLGWLLVGPMGTGKTAFVRALAQELNVPILLFDLATMSNKDFVNRWTSAKSWSPCFVLFEDINNVWRHRDNIAVPRGGMLAGLTFDCFINCIDGVENTDGLFTILTANDISELDPALGVEHDGNVTSRPGRVDRIIAFDILDADGREKLSTRILGDFPSAQWRHVLDEGRGDTGAQFQDRCCRLAMKLIWETR